MWETESMKNKKQTNDKQMFALREHNSKTYKVQESFLERVAQIGRAHVWTPVTL